MTAADKISELEAAEAAEGSTAHHEVVKVQPAAEEAPDLTKTMVHIR
jgi:hypothetical protein